MRKALIVGTNYYRNYGDLRGCVKDALNVENVLKTHENGERNFDCKTLLSTDVKNYITKKELKENIKELFEGDSNIALFYFSGHGYSDATQAYINTSDSTEADDCINLTEIMSIANRSSAKNILILLDSCFSGSLATIDNKELSILREGMTILTASKKIKFQWKLEEAGFLQIY